MKRPKLKLAAVMKNFPFQKARDIQVEAIEKVIKSYNEGAQYVFLEVPVGGGKSGIAMAIARTINQAITPTAFMVTLTEQLQTQYMEDFSQFGLRVLKGRGKYQCANAAGTCALGHQLQLRCRSCPYQAAKQAARNSDFAVCNYHSFLHNIGGPQGRVLLDQWRAGAPLALDEDSGSFPPRAIGVWDEAHTIEGFLLDQMGLEVNLSSLGLAAQLPDETTDPNPYFDFLREVLLPQVAQELKTVADTKEKEKLTSFQEAASYALARRDIDFWVPERPEMRSGNLDPDKFSLKPLQVDAYGHHLWGWADFNLFMSGTFLSAWTMVKSLGLDADKGDHIVMPSPFPAKNRPIYAGDLDMRFKARKESWPEMVKQVGRILAKHPNEKGLLLCPSNEMVEYIKKGLSPAVAGRLLLAAGANRLENYRMHIDGHAPTVLAAPGLWEGADLKDEASRFQIIPAVPRAFFKGQTEARARMDAVWYRWVNYTKLLQGTGRSVRHESDFAATYILDMDFLAECGRPDTLIPEWVREAVHEGLPAAMR